MHSTKMDRPFIHYVQKMNSPQRYVTVLEWILPDWELLYDTKYSKGLTSDLIELGGTNGALCQMSLTPMDEESHLSINLSDSLSLVALNLAIKINEEDPVVHNFMEQVLTTEKLNITIPGVVNGIENFFDTTPLTIVAKFIIVNFPDPCTGQKVPRNCFKTVKFMFDSNTPCDFFFLFETEELHAHKTILEAKSGVFKEMFASPASGDNENSIKMNDTDSHLFKVFLTYLYTGEVINLKEKVEELIFLAQEYQVFELKKLCENFMLKNIRANNMARVLRYIVIADKLNCTELKEKADDLFGNFPRKFVRAVVHEDPDLLGDVYDVYDQPPVQRPSRFAYFVGKLFSMLKL